MATCPRCGDARKLTKRTDHWLYCKLHGRVRPIRRPDSFLKEDIKKMKYLTQQDIDAMQHEACYVPEHNRSTLIQYIEIGLPVGSFIQAVLCGDLFGAFGRADHINAQHVGSICAWLYNYAPSPCFGSPEKMKEWFKNVRSDVAA